MTDLLSVKESSTIASSDSDIFVRPLFFKTKVSQYKERIKRYELIQNHELVMFVFQTKLAKLNR